MKIRLLVLLFTLSAFSLFAQGYPEVSIVDLNIVPDSVLQNATQIADLATTHSGDTVKVVGTVLFAPMVDWENDRRLTTSSAKYGNLVAFIQDTSGALWGGLTVIQSDTNFQTGFDIVDTGDVVEITGVVSEGYYHNTTTLNVLLDPLTEINIIDSKGRRPEPIKVTFDDFFEGTKEKFEAEKYEGMYVEFNNVTTTDRNPGGSTNFRFTDGSGNKISMYDQSGYNTERGHKLVGLTNYSSPADGTLLQYIRGIIHTRNDGWYIVPLYPDDMKVGTVAPAVISLIQDAKPKVAPNEAADVKFRIVDNDGSVTEVKLFYQVDNGSFNEIDMTLEDTAYVATIPGIVSDSAMVSYFIYAKDNDGNESYSPNDTSQAKYYYWVLNNDPTIYHIQVTPYRGNVSRFRDTEVTLTGILTADSSDTYSGSVQFIQEPGLTKWAGLRLVKVPAMGQKRGDLVQVTGMIFEDHFLTTMDVTSLNILSSNGDVIEPLVLKTGDIATGRNDAAEEYESMLIKYENVTVVKENADGTKPYGEMLVDDGSGGTRVELQDGNNHYHNNWDPALADSAGMIQIKTGDTFESLTGVMNYSYNNFKLIPRKDDDFAGLTDVKKLSSVPNSFELQQNYPNPFNPTTTISYTIPKITHTLIPSREGRERSGRGVLIKLKVYDILGREVATLVNQNQKPGNYKVNFNAAGLTTGIYFYQLSAGSRKIVKKMLLIK